MNLFRQTIFIFFVFVSTPLCAQEYLTETLFSNELNDERILRIYLPKSYASSPDKSYPVTLILDSRKVFETYIGNLNFFVENDAAPEHIVIGLESSNIQKSYDFEIDLTTGFPSEFGQKYMAFIQYELLSYIHDNFRISPFSCVLGHEESAAFINYFLIQETPAFNAYISIDPVYFEDFHYLIDYKKDDLDDDLYYYYKTSYNGSDPLGKKTNKQVDSVFKSVRYKSFNFEADRMRSHDRLLRFGNGVNEAIHFFYTDFAPISQEEYKLHISNLDAKETIEYLQTKYETIKYLYGDVIDIRKSDILMVEDRIIDQDNGDYLKEFGKMILELYPKEPLGYYYLGMYYEKGQAYNKALAEYKEGFTYVRGRHSIYDGYYRNIERVLEKMNEKE